MTCSHSRTVNTSAHDEAEDTQGSKKKGANGEAESRQKSGACRTESGKHRTEAQRGGKQKGKRNIENAAVKENLSRTTGNMKKPLTEVGKAAGGTGSGSQVSNGFLWGIFNVAGKQCQVQSRKCDRIRGLSYFKFLVLERSSGE